MLVDMTLLKLGNQGVIT